MKNELWNILREERDRESLEDSRTLIKQGSWHPDHIIYYCSTGVFGYFTLVDADPW